MSTSPRLSAALGLAVAALLTGCASGPLAPAAYMKWVQQPAHGLVQERTSGEVSLRLQYRPAEQVALAEFGPAITPEQLQRSLGDQQGSYRFALQLRSLAGGDALAADASTDDDYYRRLYYFTSEVENDLALVVGHDTLPCALAHFERTYGAAPYNALSVSFVDEATAPPTGDLTLIYYDRAYGLGPVSFTIKREDLQRIPALKLS